MGPKIPGGAPAHTLTHTHTPTHTHTDTHTHTHTHSVYVRGSLGCVGVLLLAFLPWHVVLHLLVVTHLVLLGHVLKLPLLLPRHCLGRENKHTQTQGSFPGGLEQVFGLQLKVLGVEMHLATGLYVRVKLQLGIIFPLRKTVKFNQTICFLLKPR